MYETFLPATNYAQRLGIDEVPDWLPPITPQFFEVIDGFDATREASGYGPASVAYTLKLETWEGRPLLVLWALLRHLLGQPGSAAMFAPEVVSEVRWSKDEALWIAAMTPASAETAHLILGALESVPAEDLALAAGDVARLRDSVTDPDLLTRLAALDAVIAATPRPEELLDPLFAERIAPILARPMGELLHNCALSRPERPGWIWQNWMKRLADGRYDDVREILTAIPAHLNEHGRFSRGEDVLRGLIFVAEGTGKGWIIPVLTDIVLAAGGTTPARSQKLANAAVEALYHRRKAKGVMRDLERQVAGKALRKRIANALRYM